MVVNCAGVATRKGPARVLLLDVFERVIRINLIGRFNVIRLGAERRYRRPSRSTANGGVIINTASVAARSTARSSGAPTARPRAVSPR